MSCESDSEDELVIVDEGEAGEPASKRVSNADEGGGPTDLETKETVADADERARQKLIEERRKTLWENEQARRQREDERMRKRHKETQKAEEQRRAELAEIETRKRAREKMRKLKVHMCINQNCAGISHGNMRFTFNFCIGYFMGVACLQGTSGNLLSPLTGI